MLLNRGYSKTKDKRDLNSAMNSLKSRRLTKQKGKYAEEETIELEQNTHTQNEEVVFVEFLVPKAIILSIFLFILAVTSFLVLQILRIPISIDSTIFWTFVILLAFSSGFLVIATALLIEKR
jgi:hypothetical protein